MLFSQLGGIDALPLQLGGIELFVLFVVLPALALASAAALSLYEVYRIGERKLLIVLVILALMLQHQVLEALTFLQTGEMVDEGLGEVFETGANLVAAGSVYYVLRFARRERRLVEELERSERQYRTLIEESPVPILLHGSREIEYANDAAVEMLDATDRSDVTGVPLSAFLAVDESKHVRETILTDGGTETIESQLRTLDDDTRQVALAGAPADHEGDRTQVVVQDLTERERRERELRAEHDRRSMLFANNPDPVVEVEFDDGRPRIIAVNGSFEDVFGFDSESIGGRTVAEALVPDDERDDYERLLERTVEGETVEAEVRRATEDGIREFLLRVIPFEIDDRGQRAYVWYTDVTEIQELKRTYRTVFESVSDGLVIHDPDTGEIVDVNERFCRMNGYEADELVGNTVDIITGPDHEYETAQARIAEAREGDGELFEWENQRKDGTTFPVEVHLSVVTIRGEERVLASVRDITERKRREREYEQIFDGVTEAIVVQDPETAEPLDANQAFLDRLGYDDVAEIREGGFDELSATQAGYTRARAQELCQRVIETGEPETVEWQQVTRTGERRWIEAKIDSAEIQGEERILSMQRDITERKRRERTIRALHESTDDLQDAETPREVCAAAVEAATEVLDLEVPTCWLHERSEDGDGNGDETGRLTPVAGSDASGDRQRAPELEPESLDPDDLEYGVYETGEPGVFDPEELDGWEPPGDAVLVPLGEHGLFGAVQRDQLRTDGAGNEDGEGQARGERAGERNDTERDGDEAEGAGEGTGVDDVALDAAGILARHVTAALDRVERAQELRESERRLRLIADHIDEIIYLAAADFSEILYINPAYEEIYGRPVAELAENPTAFVEAAHPDDRERYEADVERLITDVEAGDPADDYEGTYRIVRDGETRWVTVTRFPVENEDGTVDRIVGRVQDVTERTRREREYEQIFDGVTEPITLNDPETGEIVDVNDAMCELLGYSREEIIDRNVPGISVTEEGYTMERARAAVRRVVESGEAETFEWKLRTADGEHRWLEVTGTPAEIGGEERYLSVTRDVTERRRTERRLSEILDRIDEAIFMTHAEEITTASQSPDYVSSGYEEIWGQPLEEIHDAYDDGFFNTLHPDDEAEYRAFVEGIVDDIRDGTAADSYSREYRIERPDGEVRWVQSDFYPTEWESGPSRIVIVSRDVTDRKARERRIASFDDATDDLATADTPAEATRTAVEAAAETLGLPAVGAFLYDGDEGVLRPEVLTGPLPSEVAAEPIGPGDGPLWQGFAMGTIVAPDGGESESGLVGEDDANPDALEELAEWRGIALGNHGILVVGSPDSALDSETIQSAHVLAATLEAALNHLQGQQRLEAQEEQLRTQTERAERLDRIASLTQQVEGAITDASDPGEVERAVCERLANSGPYDLAWVAGVEVGSDRLTARAVVGARDRYVDGLDLTTVDETADPHPAVRAWRTDAVHVADSLVDDGPADDWRRHALTEGYQSLCAVPLTYDGVTHGVLTVGTDSPSAFGDRERDVLSQLGTSIANALAAIERRRALESDATVELEFRGTGDGLSFARAAAAAGCRVSLERTVARQDGDVSVYVSFEEDVPDDAAEIARRTLPGTVEVVTEEPSSILVETRTDAWFGSPLAEYGGVLREASADPDEATVTVEVPRQADVRSFTERLREIAPSLELVARRQHQRQNRTVAELGDQIRSELTDRQFEVLKTALSAGYFEWPRENDGGDVADRLGITQPTLNKHLRLAEKKTFDLLFDAEA